MHGHGAAADDPRPPKPVLEETKLTASTGVPILAASRNGKVAAMVQVRTWHTSQRKCYSASFAATKHSWYVVFVW